MVATTNAEGRNRRRPALAGRALPNTGLTPDLGFLICILLPRLVQPKNFAAAIMSLLNGKRNYPAGQTCFNVCELETMTYFVMDDGDESLSAPI